ncbi:MAG: hypothetical protein SFV32_12485 [Opitutaceae bacterium]|nr:hypothetical protein [Opitutaceae bacterium]
MTAKRNTKKQEDEEVPTGTSLTVMNGGQSDDEESEDNQGKTDESAPQGDSPASDEVPVPPRMNSDLLSIIPPYAAQIALHENEVKNFCATADFVARKVVELLAAKWPQIVKSASEELPDGESVKTASVSFGVKMDLTHPLLMDTEITMAIKRRQVKLSRKTGEDLRQVNFDLSV